MSQGQPNTSQPHPDQPITRQLVARKPLLIGGLGLAVLLWLGGSLYGVAVEWSEEVLLSLMLIGGGLWWFRGQQAPESPTPPPLTTIDSAAIAEALTQAEQTLAVVMAEAPEPGAALKSKLAQHCEIDTTQPLRGMILVETGVGKTSVLSQLTASPLTWQLTTPATLPAETHLLLWLVTGDLTESQWQQLQHWRQAAHTVVLVLTKQDQRPPEANQALLSLLRQRSQGVLPPENVVAIAADPQPILVRQHQTDGQVTEAWTTPPPDVRELLARLAQLTNPAAVLHLHRASQWRQVRQLTQQMHHTLNQGRQDTALPIIERYQWLAAGTAIANPVAALDLLATVVINTQMIMDLGEIYHCRFSLAQAQTATRELGELLVKLGAMELSTQTLSHLYKSNPITYLAGGALQGVSAAYLTRIVGLSLVDYFAQQDPLAPPQPVLDGSRLGAIVSQWLGQTQRLDLLKSLGIQLSMRLQNQPASGVEA